MNLIHLAVEKKRDQMMQTANKKGLTSNETIKLSQELDAMMNIFVPPNPEIKKHTFHIKKNVN